MWKRPVERVIERVPEEQLAKLSLQLRAIEARLEALETAREHPATLARMDVVESSVERLIADWALAKQTLTRLYGRITKTQALDRPPEPGVSEGPTSADEVFTIARQKGIIR